MRPRPHPKSSAGPSPRSRSIERAQSRSAATSATPVARNSPGSHLPPFVPGLLSTAHIGSCSPSACQSERASASSESMHLGTTLVRPVLISAMPRVPHAGKCGWMSPKHSVRVAKSVPDTDQGRYPNSDPGHRVVRVGVFPDVVRRSSPAVASCVLVLIFIAGRFLPATPPASVSVTEIAGWMCASAILLGGSALGRPRVTVILLSTIVALTALASPSPVTPVLMGCLGLLAVATTMAGRMTGGWYLAPALPALLSPTPLALLVPLALAAGVGIAWRLRTERDAAQAASRRLEVAMAREDERKRLTGELHDALGHQLSMIALHAGALADRRDLPIEATMKSGELIRASAHNALEDLRDVLDASERETSDDASWTDVARMLDAARAGGQRISYVLPDSVTSAQVDPVMYRLIQEVVTNARRHAPGEPLDLTVSHESDRLHLVARNAISHRPHTDRIIPGRGLTGMVERVTKRGGHVEWINRDGLFEIRAWLPWNE
ncbi:hypothetical protein CGZ96_10465 [Enemella evansiae]|nr:hypothetical protein CGZ96_10465 [Enemella evansiae]